MLSLIQIDQTEWSLNFSGFINQNCFEFQIRTTFKIWEMNLLPLRICKSFQACYIGYEVWAKSRGGGYFLIGLYWICPGLGSPFSAGIPELV